MKELHSEGANTTDSESPQCPACEASHSPLKETSGQYVIYLCNDCGVEYAWPRTIPHDHYEEDVYDGLDEEAIAKKSSERFLKESLKSLQVWHIEGLKWLTASQKKGSVVLDFGCGRGSFLVALQREGFIPVGLEIVGRLQRILMDKGFCVHLGSIDSYPTSWPTPHVVTSFEVLEHVARPIQTLQSIRERFPDAWLLASVPSPKTLALAIGMREESDYPPFHLTRWTEAGVIQAFRSAGYGEVQVTYPPLGASELYMVLNGLLLQKLGPRTVKSKRLQGNLGCLQSSYRTYRLLQRLRLEAVYWSIYRAIKPLSQIPLIPLAKVISARGISAQSMIVVAAPVSPPEPTVLR